MNMDCSKVFELINQDAEKERNKKAEKAVHDNLYNKGFRDGIAIIDKIRAEIIQSIQNGTLKIESGNEELFRIIDKYKAETEE